MLPATRSELEEPGMRAMQIIEWGKPLEVREYPDPEPTGEEVLLRVEVAGVCHSDVHIWDGHFDLGDDKQISLEARGVHLPFTMGHEIAGEVVALGPQARGVKAGDKVVAYPWICCGECDVCKKGEELLCLRPRTLGTRVAGGYGTHVMVPHGRYLLPYGGVPQDLAATYTCSNHRLFGAEEDARARRHRRPSGDHRRRRGRWKRRAHRAGGGRGGGDRG
jgi:alcohol dehydrogenase, propanol-preferring